LFEFCFVLFPPEVPEVFLREGEDCWQDLVVVSINSLLPSARGLEFPLFGGSSGPVLQSQ
jgi:hypothetical protein